MNPLEGLAQYLDRLEHRLRMFAWTRGAAAVAGAALILTVAIVGSLMLSAFTPSGLMLGRFVLFLGIGAAIAVGLVVPLMRMNRRRAAQEVENRHPGFDQRLLTFTERSRDNAADPFLPLLAEDALVMARDAEPEQVIDKARFIRFASMGAAAASVLHIRLSDVLPGGREFSATAPAPFALGQLFERPGRSSLFTASPCSRGSKTIRRKSDQEITASLNWLYVSARECVGAVRELIQAWEEAPMLPQSSGSGFALGCLPRVPDDACSITWKPAEIKSATYKLHTIDLTRGEEHSGHLQLPVVDGTRGGYGRSRRRFARCRRHDSEVGDSDGQASEQLAQVAFEEEQADQSRGFESNNRITTSIPIQKDGNASSHRRDGPR